MKAEKRSEKSLAAAGMQKTAHVALDKDQIISDLTDALPGDHIVLVSAEDAAEAAGSGDDERQNTPAFQVDRYIRNITQTAAVTDIDDLLALQIGKPVAHSITLLAPPILCARHEEDALPLSSFCAKIPLNFVESAGLTLPVFPAKIESLR